MLTEKCKNQEQMIAEFEMREGEYQELEGENDLLRQQVDSSRLVFYKSHVYTVPWPGGGGGGVHPQN